MWMIQANKEFDFAKKNKQTKEKTSINISTRYDSVSLTYNIVALSRTAFVGTP